MKYLYIALTLILLQNPLFSQISGSLNFINTLGNKEVTTYEDAMTFFVIVLEKAPANFNANKRIVSRQIKSSKKIILKKNDPISRGAVALLIADHLKLSNSIMYNVFKAKPYAVQACIAEGIMDANCSSNDKLSGEEFIEIMNKVSEFKGGNK